MREKPAKSPSDSVTIMTEIVLPNDTNTLNNLRGGKLLHWMDVACAITAGKHAERVVVTASVDSVSWSNPIKLGDVVTIEAKATHVFTTSMEIFVQVWAENLPSGTRYKCNEAYFTFVALDSNGKPTAVPKLNPQTEEEQRLYQGAIRRRQLRLVLAGRMKPDEATELKSLFVPG